MKLSNQQLHGILQLGDFAPLVEQSHWGLEGHYIRGSYLAPHPSHLWSNQGSYELRKGLLGCTRSLSRNVELDDVAAVHLEDMGVPH